MRKFQPVKSIEKPFLNDTLKVWSHQCDATHKKRAERCSYSSFSVITRKQCTTAKNSSDKKDFTFNLLQKKFLHFFRQNAYKVCERAIKVRTVFVCALISRQNELYPHVTDCRCDVCFPLLSMYYLRAALYCRE